MPNLRGFGQGLTALSEGLGEIVKERQREAEFNRQKLFMQQIQQEEAKARAEEAARAQAGAEFFRGLANPDPAARQRLSQIGLQHGVDFSSLMPSVPELISPQLADIAKRAAPADISPLMFEQQLPPGTERNPEALTQLMNASAARNKDIIAETERQRKAKPVEFPGINPTTGAPTMTFGTQGQFEGAPVVTGPTAIGAGTLSGQKTVSESQVPGFLALEKQKASFEPQARADAALRPDVLAEKDRVMRLEAQLKAVGNLTDQQKEYLQELTIEKAHQDGVYAQEIRNAEDALGPKGSNRKTNHPLYQATLKGIEDAHNTKILDILQRRQQILLPGKLPLGVTVEPSP